MYFVNSSDMRIYETTVELGGSSAVTTVLVVPEDFTLESLAFSQPIHTDGSIHGKRCHDSTSDCQYTTVTLTVGQSRRIGAWDWSALPHSLTGVYRH